MTRSTSKNNLNTVVETFVRKRNYALFDKFWYLKRAEKHDAKVTSGFTVDRDEVLQPENYQNNNFIIGSRNDRKKS